VPDAEMPAGLLSASFSLLPTQRKAVSFLEQIESHGVRPPASLFGAKDDPAKHLYWTGAICSPTGAGKT